MGTPLQNGLFFDCPQTAQRDRFLAGRHREFIALVVHDLDRAGNDQGPVFSQTNGNGIAQSLALLFG